MKRVRRRAKVSCYIATAVEDYLFIELCPIHRLMEDKNDKKHKALGKANAIQAVIGKRRRPRKPRRPELAPDTPIEQQLWKG